MKKLLETLSLTPSKETRKALLISFIIINLCFLYHTLNFMWGNHDVKFIKEELLLSSGLFEGRFTQFIPQKLLTSGQILPLMNNLIGFIFLTLALYILGLYWKLPKTTLNYTLFITFFITQPYTLSWLYFNLYTISCMAWAFFAILGLYLSLQIPNHPQKQALSLTSILCFYLPLGGYPPIINTIFVCLSAKITLDVIFHQSTIKELFSTYKYTLFNILIALILFKLTLYFIPKNIVYNLETTPFDELPQKFISTLKISFNQFFLSLPFMEKGYKIILAVMSFIAILSSILRPIKLSNLGLIILLFLASIWLTQLTTFLVVPPTQYVARIDFYGLGFLYTFFVCLLLRQKPKIFESIGIIFAFVIIYINILNCYHAQYVWQEGFKHEFKILESIYERIESHPNFNPKQKYRIYQAGDISMRPIYYNKKFDKNEAFLLLTPYLATWQTKNLIEFYSPYKFINTPDVIIPSDITPEVKDFINNHARIWPEKNSIYINKNIIIIILNQIGLKKLRKDISYIYS